MGFPSLRTAQFAAGLVDAGHEVRLALLAPDAEAASSPKEWHGPGPTAIEAVDTIRTDLAGAMEQLGRIRREFEPDAVVTAGPFLPMALGAALVDEEPLWVDVPGDPMAEAQARAAADGDDTLLARWFEVYGAALARGDSFSAIGERQRAALLGALGVSGRLTGAGLGDPLVHVVRGSSEPTTWSPTRGELELQVPEDALVLLFSGGWNTWLDHETLVEAVLRAMQINPSIHFVATGGPIAGHHTEAFESFRATAEASDKADRFHFLGWVDADLLDAVYSRADVAVCLDRRCHEAELGARTRLLEAMQRGLQIASTAACEVTQRMQEEAGFSALPSGSVAGAAEVLASLKRGPGEWGAMVTDHTVAATTEPLVRWCSDPRRGPERFDLGAAADDERRALRDELSAVYSTPTWRLLSRLRGKLGG